MVKWSGQFRFDPSAYWSLRRHNCTRCGWKTHRLDVTWGWSHKDCARYTEAEYWEALRDECPGQHTGNPVDCGNCEAHNAPYAFPDEPF